MLTTAVNTPLPGNPRNARLHYVTFGAFLLSRRRFCGAFDLTRRLTFASCSRSCASDAFVCEAGGGGGSVCRRPLGIWSIVPEGRRC